MNKMTSQLKILSFLKWLGLVWIILLLTACPKTNIPPIANAGKDRTALIGVSVVLDASDSKDANNDTLTYRWTLIEKPTGSAVVLSDPLTKIAQFKPDVLGNYTAQLIVNDSLSDSQPDTVLINVTATPQNQAPKITSTAVTTVVVGQPYSYTVQATDVDSDPLNYTLTTAPNGMSIHATTGVILWTPLPEQVGSHAVNISVSDGKQGSDVQSFSLTVSAAVNSGIVPKVIGLARSKAENQIKQAKLNVGTLTFQHSDTVVDGQVISQSPNADSAVDFGTPVNLVVSLGKDNGLPPNPETVALNVDPTVATSTYAATQFLYSGANPIQTGVKPETIEAKRVAVLRGKVLDKQNNPLSGVTITILNHPEFGQTLSRADGMFDMAVNGGGQLTVRYAKDAFLASQRAIVTPWQDYAWLPDVVMIPFDTAVTTVDLSSATMQLARGNPVSDADGARQATVLVPAGTSAEMVLPDGSRQVLTTLHVRATEYTVGNSGQKAMPAPLPPSSGYTYAAEFSVDEVVAAGATDVSFNQALPVYVENFLGFPVGGAVPAGYYDRQKGQWIASANGRVIKLLSVTNGLADLDIDGNGVADDAAALLALGVKDDERSRLAQLYKPNQTLWRVPITHFTPWDFNWPFAPPRDAIPPSGQKNYSSVDDQSQQCGSVIGCENQTLGESVSINGTPLRLHYKSDRVSGRKAIIKIPLSGETQLPTGLKRIELEVSVAGQYFTKKFPALPNQTYTFTWDGNDGFGRSLQGAQTATINIGYVYNGAYLQPSEKPGSEYEALFGHFSYYGTPVSGNRERVEVTLSKTWTEQLGEMDIRALGLGGWSLNTQHVYDPFSKTLLLGNGQRRSTKGMKVFGTITTVVDKGLSRPEAIAVASDGSMYIPDSLSHRVFKVAPNGVVSTVAGNGNNGFCDGDGGLATKACLFYPGDVAVTTEGTLYIADTYNNRIRKVTSDGIITTVAGGKSGFCGDGGLATQACLSSPEGLTTAPDGSLYIADSGNHRIRKVDTNGIISTVAGSTYGFCGDLGSALQACLNTPYDVVVAIDGSLLIADTGNNRIRKVTSDGIITTVAGNGTGGFCGDGGSATQACLTPWGVDVTANGTLFITDYGNHRIRKVMSDGIITTMAGSGTTNFCGDDDLPIRACLHYMEDSIVAPDGSLYIADTGNRRIRRIAPPLPGFTGSDIMLTSEDGQETYGFAADGRHQQTRSTLTGAVLQQFSYDGTGQLASITDASGNITKIERTGATPTAIVAPDGQRTSLVVNADGWLQSVSNPAGETHTMSYSTDGLLQSFTDPLGNSHPFTYDALGLLIKDADPAGGSTSLSRTDQDNGHTVTTTSALNRSHSYQVEQLPTGTIRRSVTQANGTKTVTLINTDGSEQTTNADGSVAIVQKAPDPRWGMLAPITQKATLTNAGGLSQTLTSTRETTLSEPLNLLSLTKLTDTVTLNGRVSTSVYDATTKTATSTSAAGRQSKAILDNLGRVVESQVTGLLSSNLNYDARGRLASVSQGTTPDIRTATFSYNTSGYLDTVTDPLGRKASYSYDAAGRVTKQTLPDGREITYSYDANGNLTSLSPPGRPGHVFRYTAINQTKEYEPPLVAGTGSTLYTYDLDKALTKITRPDGQTLNFSYDASKGRLTDLTLPTGQISYAYDAITGKLTGITAPDGGTLAYTYNGALLTKTAWTGLIAGSVDRSYDNDFRVTSLSVNGANPIAYQYDADSLLTKAGDLTLTRNTQNGLLTATTLGSLSDAYSYDGFAEITAYEAKYGASSLLRFEYDHDKLGRITQKRQLQSGVTYAFDYGYDKAGRLIEVKLDSVVTASYGYDTNGNRTHLNGAEVAHYDNQDRLLDYQGTTYQYTANGELQQKTVAGQMTQYDYDVLGNLRKVNLLNSTVIEYLIDGQNRRIGKKRNGSLEQAFLYQGQLQPIAELDGTGAIVSRFVYATGINVPDYMVKGGVTYRIIKDHLGSPRLIVDVATNTVAQQMDYDAFGNVTLDSNPGFQPFGFAGGLYDRDTKLVRFGARDYEAETGRWMAKDPIGFASGDVNFAIYVNANPVNLIDTSGLDVDLNLIPNNTVKNRQLIKNLQNVEDTEYLTVAVHANANGFFGPNGKLTIDELYDLIQKIRNEKDNRKPVKLLACNAAGNTGDSSRQPVAKQLANRMFPSGIMASTTKVTVDSEGNVTAKWVHLEPSLEKIPFEIILP